MVEIQKHRGPDGSDIWSDQYISVGHNRLAIIDLSEEAKQPMRRGDWVIVYNGEIYNFMELRKELKVKHIKKFIAESDSEVILAAWETWHESALERFRGMWAFAIYNLRTQDLYLCRDRFGIKPLYYSDQKAFFCFASEIKAILTYDSVPRSIYLPAVVDYLFGFHDHNENTFFKNISKSHQATFYIIT